MPVVHSSASAFSTAGVLLSQGPSSKVSTTSFSLRKSSSLKCSKPKPGPPVVSISTVRATPSAFGLVQEARAGCGGWAAAAGAGAAAAAGGAAAAGLAGGVCDHAALDMNSESVPATMIPAAIRMLFSLKFSLDPDRPTPCPGQFLPLSDNTLVAAAPPTQRRGRHTFGFVAGPVNCGALRGRQRPRYRGLHPRVRGLDAFGKDLRNISLTADQVFVEVPARNLLGPRLGRPFVEGMRIRSLHDHLAGDRERDAVVMLRLGDLLGPAGLLAAEIIGGHADDDKPAFAKLAPQFLQARILRGVAALRGGVDDEQRPAGE